MYLFSLHVYLCIINTLVDRTRAPVPGVRDSFEQICAYKESNRDFLQEQLVLLFDEFSFQFMPLPLILECKRQKQVACPCVLGQIDLHSNF